MTNYTPKPGDIVKATLGDSVLYGKIVNVYGDVEHALLVESNTAAYEFMLTSEWQIEPWSPPVTFKLLTVVRLAPDSAYAIWNDEHPEDISPFKKPLIANRSYEDSWESNSTDWFEFIDEDIQRALAAGKAEVLFEGVDE